MAEKPSSKGKQGETTETESPSPAPQSEQPEKAPEKRLADKDTRRRVNYKHYTDREWGMAQNYHITLDSGVLGIDRCVEIILDLAQRDYPENK